METPDFLSLQQLLQRVSDVVNSAFATPVWIVAELSDVRHNANGHCYLQLIEKDPHRGNILATARAIIWANRWWMIRDGFYQATGQTFQSGIKVMLQVQVSMHEQYGISINILDFDPSYTLGDMERHRREILRQLEQDGVIDMNRELTFPTLPQRIAVISAEGAAGFGDFIRQLDDNTLGLRFYCHLFTAVMQGDQTASTVSQALDSIYQVQDLFDVVVIIRGGGATVDLASFDDYELAYSVAQFPLPVITGIGHDRDKTVLDCIAHTSVKTPTAAAALLIDTLSNALQQVLTIQQQVVTLTTQRMEGERKHLQHIVNAVRSTQVTLGQQISHIDMICQKLQMLTHQRIQREQDRLSFMSQTIQMAQPDNILRRGFSITRLNGHAVKAATSVPQGSTLQIQTADGEITAHT